jgi:hypothetical protein
MPTRAASVPVTSTYWPVAVTAAGKAGSLHIGESKLTIVIMDSGLALGAPRNDGRQQSSANRARGFGPGWCGRCGRQFRPRCQHAQLMRRGRGSSSRRLFPDIRDAQHWSLHRRYRQTRRFIGRQFRREAGCAARHRDHGGGGDGKVSLLHRCVLLKGFQRNLSLPCCIAIVHRCIATMQFRTSLMREIPSG